MHPLDDTSEPKLSIERAVVPVKYAVLLIALRVYVIVMAGAIVLRFLR